MSFASYLRSGWHYLEGGHGCLHLCEFRQLFLYVFSGPTILGLYDAAYKLLQPFYAVGAVVGDSMYRQLARALHTPDLSRVFRRWVDLMGAPTLPLGFVCFVDGPWIIDLIYGSQYVDAGPYLALLGWVITVGYGAGIITIPFSAWSVPREYGNSILTGGVVSLVLNLALISTFAGFGAAIATIFAKLAVGVVGIHYFRRIAEYPVLRDLGFYMGVAALCVFLAWLTGRLGIAVPVQLGLAGAIYALIVGLARFRPYDASSLSLLRPDLRRPMRSCTEGDLQASAVASHRRARIQSDPRVDWTLALRASSLSRPAHLRCH